MYDSDNTEYNPKRQITLVGYFYLLLCFIHVIGQNVCWYSYDFINSKVAIIWYHVISITVCSLLSMVIIHIRFDPTNKSRVLFCSAYWLCFATFVWFIIGWANFITDCVNTRCFDTRPLYTFITIFFAINVYTIIVIIGSYVPYIKNFFSYLMIYRYSEALALDTPYSENL